MEWSKYQTAIFGAVEEHKRDLVIQACAGSGKTTVAREVMLRSKGQNLYTAFNVDIVNDPDAKMPKHVDCRGLNSLGMQTVMRNRRGKVEGKKLDLLFNKAFRMDLTIARDKAAVLKLVRFAKANLLMPSSDPTHWQALIDQQGLAAQELDDDHLIAAARMVLDLNNRQTGMIDFDDQIYFPAVFGWAPTRYDTVLVDEFQDMTLAQIRLVLSAARDGGRIIVVGDRHQCHPPGTLITLTGGKRKRIEDVRKGDELVTYHDCFRGIRSQGRRVEAVGCREIDGELLHVTAGAETVVMTDNHRVLTKFTQKKNGWAVYVTEKNGICRVGCCKLYYKTSPKGGGSFGPAMRSRQEQADKMWVLRVFEDRDEAKVYETLVALEYKLPERCRLYQEGIGDKLAKAIGDNRERAKECIEAHGRVYDYPLWEKGNGAHIGKCYSFVTQACNLIEGYSALRTYEGHRDGGGWLEVEVNRAPYRGPVYSLQVEPTEGGLRLYVADNILVHNSIYRWRGAFPEAIDAFKQERQALELPLSISYRCARNIVAHAQDLVPEIEAAPDAPDGEVEYLPGCNVATFRAGDLIVSRRNAPLVSIAYKLLADRVPIHFVRKDIGAAIMKTIRNLEATTRDKMIDELTEWEVTESNRRRREGKDAAAEQIEQRAETARVVLQHCKASQREPILEEIKAVFDRPKRQDSVILSSVHRAKGAEADRVFILNEKDMEPDWVKDPERRQEERNIHYVAITRAKTALAYVDEASYEVVPAKQYGMLS